ncbi:MAG: 50S ribosomal protein L5 [Minisyncoccia bacterium]
MKLPYKEQFKKVVIPEMIKQFNLKSPLAVCKIEKVVINTGIGRLVTSSKNSEEIVEKVADQLKMITGLKPSIRPAKVSISSFKLREGMPVGLKVTLRGKRMEDFIYKFINIVLPRIRDFWGIKDSNIDAFGNLNYGIKEQTVFPEISKEQASFVFGLEVTFVTNAKNRQMAKEMYRLLGFPLEKSD